MDQEKNYRVRGQGDLHNLDLQTTTLISVMIRNQNHKIQINQEICHRPTRLNQFKTNQWS